MITSYLQTAQVDHCYQSSTLPPPLQLAYKPTFGHCWRNH